MGPFTHRCSLRHKLSSRRIIFIHQSETLSVSQLTANFLFNYRRKKRKATFRDGCLLTESSHFNNFNLFLLQNIGRLTLFLKNLNNSQSYRLEPYFSGNRLLNHKFRLQCCLCKQKHLRLAGCRVLQSNAYSLKTH